MPPQAVTLEPLVQGERSLATFRLPERIRHAHQRKNHILFGMKYRLRGLARLRTSQRNLFENLRYSVTSLYEIRV